MQSYFLNNIVSNGLSILNNKLFKLALFNQSIFQGKIMVNNIHYILDVRVYLHEHHITYGNPEGIARWQPCLNPQTHFIM